VPYTVTITDTVTNETVRSRFACEWEDHFRFLWEDGNFSCDCNRSLEFQRAKGQEPDIMKDNAPCNTCEADRRFRVDSIVLDNGEVVYRELNPSRN
jgi:hypothetical protein